MLLLASMVSTAAATSKQLLPPGGKATGASGASERSNYLCLIRLPYTRNYRTNQRHQAGRNTVETSPKLPLLHQRFMTVFQTAIVSSVSDGCLTWTSEPSTDPRLCRVYVAPTYGALTQCVRAVARLDRAGFC